MQVSSTQLFVFVEGKSCDSYFYSQACAAAVGDVVDYKMVTADTLPGNWGGKSSLIGFFELLRTRNALVTTLGGPRTASLFFLDKDLDDISRTRKRSRHVVYTRYYDVENYVYEYGDLARGAACAASVDPRTLRANIGDSASWCRRMAANWKDWIALCMRMQASGIQCEANFRRPSPLQSRPCGPVEPAEYSRVTRQIARRAGVPVSQLRQDVAETRVKVDRYFTRNDHHKIFKGKWFAGILADEVRRILQGVSFCSGGLESRITHCVALTLDFTQSWAEHFRTAILDVAALI